MLLQTQVMYSCSINQNERNKVHLEIIKQMCEGRTNCLMIAENVLFQSSLKCPRSGGQVWMSYSCGNNGAKESTPCQPLQTNNEDSKIGRSKKENIFQKNYLCNKISVNFTLHVENPDIDIIDGSSVSGNIDGGSSECPKKCGKDSNQIYDGNLIEEFQHFGPSFQVEFEVLMRQFNGLVFNILDSSNKVILSVTAKKSMLTVAYLEKSKMKYYTIKDLIRNTWYKLTMAQKQSGESMYEVV